MEQEYGYTNQPIREPQYTNQRYSFWMIVRRMLPNVSLKHAGFFVGRKNGKETPYNHSTVYYGISEARLNFERPDFESVAFTAITKRIEKRVHDLLGDQPIYSTKTKQRYRKGVERVKTTYKQLRILESKLHKCTNPEQREHLQAKILFIQNKKRSQSKTTIHQPKQKVRRAAI
jgi:hypothetical protein